MVKGIEFKKYKKFNNQSFVFSPDINVISGENGTCKSSLLYLIGNSFQSVKKKKRKYIYIFFSRSLEMTRE